MNTRSRRTALGLAAASLAALFVMPTTAHSAPANPPPIGLVCSNGVRSGTDVTFNLTAKSGYIDTPDGNSIFMWGYANDDEGGTYQDPGPYLCAQEGDTVHVHLTNTLPEPVSITFPGQAGVVGSGGTCPGTMGCLLAREAATSDTVTYTFTAGHPGTFLYESGTDLTKQVEMGLYGAFIVRPAGHPNWAFDDSRTQFDPSREYVLLLGEIDPDLHHAVETGAPYDITKLRNRYFQVNGRSFPDTIQDNGVAWLPHQPYGSLVRVQPFSAATNPQPAMIRMLNAGLVNHPFHPHGNLVQLIGQDGRELLSPGNGLASTDHFGDNVNAGETQDFLFSWPDQDHWNPNTNPFPVTIPNYRNLTFKDNNTWYAGNPYLGSKGTLPTVVTSQNMCGEWYFPWHSHALYEFANYDAGFGGMATLLRVDPLGGCTGFPTSTTVISGGGTVRSGTFAALGAADTTYLRVNSTTSGNPRTTNWYAGFSGIALGSKNLAITYNGRNCGTATTPSCPTLAAPPPANTQLYLYNWVTKVWDAVGAVTPIGSAADGVIQPAAIVDPTAYIRTGANKGQLRIRVSTSRAAATNFVTRANLLTIRYDAP